MRTRRAATLSRLAASVTGTALALAIPAAPASADTELRFIPACTQDATAVALSPDGATAYVTCQSDDELAIVDLASLVVTTVAVTGGPRAVAVTPDGTRVVVANGTGDTVQVIDPLAAGGPAVIRTTVGLDAPYGVAIDPTGSFAYVANTGAGELARVNLATGLAVQVPVGGMPTMVEVAPDGTTVYVAGAGNLNGELVRVDAASFTVVPGRILLTAGVLGTAITPDGSTLIATGEPTGAVYAIDLRSWSLRTTTVGVAAPWGAAVSPDGRKAHVAAWGSNTVDVYRVSDLAFLESVPVSGIPTDVAFAPSGDRSYATVFGGLSEIGVDALPPDPAGGGSPRVAPIQQFEPPAGAACADSAPAWVNWPGIAGLERDGWGASWASWPNGGLGGTVCSREVRYADGRWRIA